MKVSAKYVLFVLSGIAVTAAAVWFISTQKSPQPIPPPPPSIRTFHECVAAGNPVMESQPRQCRSGNQTFSETIAKATTTADMIHVATPLPNTNISSPLVISGEARGSWFFEGSFPVLLTDWDGKVVAQGVATTNADWMTTNFIPFTATLTFTKGKNLPSNKGTLILKKDNPSGLPQNDKAIEIPVTF